MFAASPPLDNEAIHIAIFQALKRRGPAQNAGLMTGEPLGFIGLGNMGGAVAGRIKQAGYAMVVYDIRAEAATMAPHYEVFYSLETSIRTFVSESIGAEDGDDWWNAGRAVHSNPIHTASIYGIRVPAFPSSTWRTFSKNTRRMAEVRIARAGGLAWRFAKGWWSC